MKKSDVAGIYTMEELIPIVGELAKRYTMGESSSVTYERARSMMEATMYCIRHFYEKDSESSLASVDKIPAREAYRRGYRAVCEKVQKAQEKYNRLMTYFCHYGNENYRDTVEKAIPGFFSIL